MLNLVMHSIVTSGLYRVNEEFHGQCYCAFYFDDDTVAHEQ
jgi:ferredoxin-thioredoxin reductase catalytic subunit